MKILSTTLTVLFLLACVFISLQVKAQSPEKMSYQAVVRDMDQKLVKNESIGMQISILQNSVSGLAVYVETHSCTSNANGLVTLEIGAGTIVSGNFSLIDWSDGPYFIKTETDPLGGANYTIEGTSQLLSVPYALYADKAGNTNFNDTSSTNEIQTISYDSSVVSFSKGGGSFILNNNDNDSLNEIQTLSKKGNVITLSQNGGSITDENTIYSSGYGLYLTGTTFQARYSAAMWNANRIQDKNISSTNPKTNQVLKWNGAAWTPMTDENTTYSSGSGIVLNGNSITAIDTSDINEIQAIGISNDTIFLANGGFVKLPAEADPVFGASVAKNITSADTLNWNSISTSLTDADTDTKIQLEENTDEDIIRFDIAGTEKMVITQKALEFTNNDSSVFIGQGAGNSISGNEAGGNIFIGYRSGFNNTYSSTRQDRASHNIFIGQQAGYSNTYGNKNTAIGYKSLYNNTTGYYNTANGYRALYSNLIGIGNTANGFQALHSNYTGSSNSAYGYKALYSNNPGHENTATGSRALYYNYTGYSNSAYGSEALNFNNTGYSNSAYGYRALYSNKSGHYNTALGYQAYYNDTAFSNSTAIGNGAEPNASNVVILGNSSVSWVGCVNSTFYTSSDKRIKNNIKEDVKGLDFIMKLRPVTYTFDKDKFDDLLTVVDSSNYAEKYDVEKIKQSGFIAQEVEAAAVETAYDFSGVRAPTNDKTPYSLSYAQFVVPLVKGMQEQQTLIEQQNEKIAELERLLLEMQRKMD